VDEAGNENTVAYGRLKLITVVKRFIAQAQGVIVIFFALKARVFVTCKHFHPSVVLAGETRHMPPLRSTVYPQTLD
jgi:hypothetical protein